MNKRYDGTYSYQKDIGKVRVANEDECVISVNAHGDVLMMVADGMGGHKKGDYASHETISYIKDEFNSRGHFLNQFDALYWLKKIVHDVNKHIFDISDTDVQYKGMGTTLVLVLIYRNKLIILNAGDSRCYLFKNRSLKQMTEDQTYVNYLYKSGQIKQEEIATHPRRHVLTNAVGLFPSISVDIKMMEYHGEGILLCSDGLYNNISDVDIENVLRTDQSSEQKVSSLINIANFNGGSDNISIALWESIDDKN